MTDSFIICGDTISEEDSFYECSDELNMYVEEETKSEEYIDNKLLYFMIICQCVRCTLEYI